MADCCYWSATECCFHYGLRKFARILVAQASIPLKQSLGGTIKGVGKKLPDLERAAFDSEDVAAR